MVTSFPLRVFLFCQPKEDSENFGSAFSAISAVTHGGKPESSLLKNFWTPAFAGMTTNWGFPHPAKRYGLKVILVSNSRMRTPQEDWIEAVVVEGQFNAADDWLAGQAGGNDIVVTADIPWLRGAWQRAPGFFRRRDGFSAKRGSAMPWPPATFCPLSAISEK